VSHSTDVGCISKGDISEETASSWNYCIADDSISVCPEYVSAVYGRWVPTSKLPATGIFTACAMYKNRCSAVWEIHSGTRKRGSCLQMKKLLLANVAALFLATETAHAQTEADTFYVAACLEYDSPKTDGDDCVVVSLDGQGLKGCELLRKLLLKQKFLISRCAKTEEKAKADPDLSRELANRPRGRRL
jgi:hypothetical protein